MTIMTNPGRPPTVPKRARSRRSRTVRRLVIALVVLLGLLVAADFGAAAVFEHEVSKRARAEFGLTDDPDVRVHGFSFLLQALSGEYGHVEVRAQGVPVQNTLRDLTVEADLFGVQAPLGDLISGSARVTVREVEGTVEVQASDVSRAIAQQESEVLRSITQVSIDPVSEKAASLPTEEEADRLSADERDPAKDLEDTKAGARICFTADVVGVSTDLCVVGIITLAETTIAFVPSRAGLRNELTSGALSSTIQDSVLSALGRVSLDPGVLPFRVTPTAVEVPRPGVLSVTGEAENVALSGG